MAKVQLDRHTPIIPPQHQKVPWPPRTAVWFVGPVAGNRAQARQSPCYRRRRPFPHSREHTFFANHADASAPTAPVDAPVDLAGVWQVERPDRRLAALRRPEPLVDARRADYFDYFELEN